MSRFAAVVSAVALATFATGGNAACAAKDGTFVNAKGSCQLCPRGRSLKVKSGGGPVATHCDKCASGKYTAGTGQAACAECAQGKYASGKGNSVCRACWYGTFCPKASGVMLRCPRGKYNDQSGQKKCVDCPAGRTTFTTKRGIGQRGYLGSKIPAGYTGPYPYQDFDYFYYNHFKWQCAFMEKPATGGSCPLGFYRLKDGITCQACERGRYGSKKNGATMDETCAICDAGKYSAKPGQTACTACPSGRTTDTGSCKNEDITLYTKATGHIDTGHALFGLQHFTVKQKPLRAVEPLNACEPLTNPSEIKGNVALVMRGKCFFSLKLMHVQRAGGLAMVLVNNQPGQMLLSGGSCNDIGYNEGCFSIGYLFVRQEDGKELFNGLRKSSADLLVDLHCDSPALHDQGPLAAGAVASAATNSVGTVGWNGLWGGFADDCKHHHKATPPCPPGLWARVENGAAAKHVEDQCSFCPIGRYGVGGGTSMVTGCKVCADGRYSDKTGQTTCAACPAGKSTIGGSRREGDHDSKEKCIKKCPAGKFVDDPEEPDTACYACDAGTYSDIVSATECKSCTYGKYMQPAKTASTTDSDCSDCAAGYTDNNGLGSTGCKLGPKRGEYVGVTGTGFNKRLEIVPWLITDTMSKNLMPAGKKPLAGFNGRGEITAWLISNKASKNGNLCGVIPGDNGGVPKQKPQDGDNAYVDTNPHMPQMQTGGKMETKRQITWVRYKDNGKCGVSSCGGCNNGYGVNMECHYVGKSSAGHDNVFGWLATYVKADKDRKVELWAGSDDGHMTYLNGALVIDNQKACRCYSDGQDKMTVTLKVGWNTIIMKVGEKGGNFGAVAGFTDTTGLCASYDGKTCDSTDCKAQKAGATLCGVIPGHDGVVGVNSEKPKNGANAYVEPFTKKQIKWVPYRENGLCGKSACGGCNGGWGVNMECHFTGKTSAGSDSDNVYAYLATYVKSDITKDVELRTGSDDGHVAYVNGKVAIDASTGCHCYASNQYRKVVALQKGWNTIILKIGENGGNYGAVVGFKDTNGLCASIDGVNCGSGAASCKGPVNDKALKCPEGKYQPRSGRQECINCPAGRYGTAVGAIALAQCIVCPTGFITPVPRVFSLGYVRGGATKCTVCPSDTTTSTSTKAAQHIGVRSCRSRKKPPNCAPGTFGVEKCDWCEPGTFTDTTNRAYFCTPCTVGRYTTVGKMWPGSSSCTACPAGLTTSLATFNDFPLGSYWSFHDSVNDCRLKPMNADETCPVGSYYTKDCTDVHCSGRVFACRACGAGRASAYQGATKAGQCTFCPAGKFASGLGNTGCTACPASKFAPNVGARSCVGCPLGRFSSTVGSTKITDCQLGYAPPPPPGCGPGEFVKIPKTSAAGSTVTCQVCPVGRYSLLYTTSIGWESNCISCIAGKTTTIASGTDVPEQHDEQQDCTYPTCHGAKRSGRDLGFCTEMCPCMHGEGDCDKEETHSDCAGSAVCAQNVGTLFGMSKNDDVCVIPGKLNCATLRMVAGNSKKGDATFCSAACPCNHGEGHCKYDSVGAPKGFCAKGLHCMQGAGDKFSLKALASGAVDVCIDPAKVNCAAIRKLSNGHVSYCSPGCPCRAGEGNCDPKMLNLDCAAGLICKPSIGAYFSQPSANNVCVSESWAKTGSCHGQFPNGAPDFCTEDCPCVEGQGDCDEAVGDCQGELKCVQDAGGFFGLLPSTDVCLPPAWASKPPCSRGGKGFKPCLNKGTCAELRAADKAAMAAGTMPLEEYRCLCPAGVSGLRCEFAPLAGDLKAAAAAAGASSGTVLIVIVFGIVAGAVAIAKIVMGGGGVKLPGRKRMVSHHAFEDEDEGDGGSGGHMEDFELEAPEPDF